MPTNAEIKALIQKEVRQQKSHLVRNGLAYILDSIIDNIGAGPGGTPGIDDVLAEEQMVISRYIELQVGGFFEIVTGSTRDLLELDTTVGDEKSTLKATNITGNGNQSRIELGTENGQATFDLTSDFNDGVKAARIQGFADASSSTITHTADIHTVNAGANGTSLFLDGTTNNDQARLLAANPTGDGNFSQIKGVATNTDATASILANFNDGVKTATVEAFADATTSTITHTAGQHILVGAVMLPTSDPGVSGAIWNNAGTPAISV